MPDDVLGIQYAAREQHREAVTLGMWAFLATELLFFGSLVAGYLNYRIWFGQAWIAAASHTKIILGTVNTAILLTSSACMAMAVMTRGTGKRRAPVLWLLATALLGLAFVLVKGFEYYLEFHEHLVPALNFDAARYGDTAEIFFFWYFCATGLHALHLLIGIGMVVWLALAISRDTLESPSPLRLIGLYWHFVDVVWIFLFPLIYLAGRNG